MLDRIIKTGQGFGTYYKLGRCYLRNKVLHWNTISSIEMISTLKCNPRSAFCSNFTLAPENTTMSREVAFSALEQVVRLKIPSVIFLDAEGRLDENIPDYLAFCRRHGIMAMYGTDGTGLTAENVARLKEGGVSGVCITVHDGVPEKHDAIVGAPGALETIIQGIGLLKKHGIKVSGKTIYSRESATSGAFRRALDLCWREEVTMSANPYLPVGRGIAAQDMLTPAELDRYYQICREAPVSDHVYNGWYSGCNAGQTYFCILTDGQMLPCYFLPISVGNVLTRGMDEAQKICRQIPLFAKRHKICPVAGSTVLFEEIIRPLYADTSIKLPVDITQDSKLFEKLRAFKV